MPDPNTKDEIKSRYRKEIEGLERRIEELQRKNAEHQRERDNPGVGDDTKAALDRIIASNESSIKLAKEQIEHYNQLIRDLD
jgi:hypothetical protein